MALSKEAAALPKEAAALPKEAAHRSLTCAS